MKTIGLVLFLLMMYSSFGMATPVKSKSNSSDLWDELKDHLVDHLNGIHHNGSNQSYTSNATHSLYNETHAESRYYNATHRRRLDFSFAIYREYGRRNRTTKFQTKTDTRYKFFHNTTTTTTTNTGRRYTNGSSTVDTKRYGNWTTATNTGGIYTNGSSKVDTKKSGNRTTMTNTGRRYINGSSTVDNKKAGNKTWNRDSEKNRTTTVKGDYFSRNTTKTQNNETVVVNKTRSWAKWNHTSNDCVQELDVMIILDGSSSVTTSNFDLIKKWVKNLAVGLHIDHGHVQIGVVQYSSYVNRLPINQQRYIMTEIELGEYTTKAEFDAAVDAIRYQNGKKTFTAKAIEKTVKFDFHSKSSRYPEARRNIILLTDGKAKDSDDLPAVIELAHNAGAYIIPIGVGNFNHDELVLLAHHHSEQIFEVENFDDLENIVSDVHESLRQVCNCNTTGSLDTRCDPCTSQCHCRPNVEGIDCDKCVDNYFGFMNPNGCEECGCNPDGIEPGTFCHPITGICECRWGFAGESCDVCDDGFYNFPNCYPCECNGNAWECDDNGICVNCTDGYVGDHCEYCGPGTYWNPDEEICFPCPCNGYIDETDRDSCDPETGECLKCLGNRAGVTCEICEEFFFMQEGECVACGCNLEGTVREKCLEQDMCMCDQADGRCECLPNVVGDKCDKCAPGYTGMEAGVGCFKCSCDDVGIMEQTLCDPYTGDCQCKSNHRGRHCRECDIGYARDDLQSPCIKIIPPTTTTITLAELRAPTTPATTTTKAAKPAVLPVNPGWSPCVGCGGGSSSSSSNSGSYSPYSWPSYCTGYHCRRRWPYYQGYNTYAPRRCSPYNYSCRQTVQNSYYSPSQQYGQASYSLYRAPKARYVAPMMNRRRSTYNTRRYQSTGSSNRYGLYRRLAPRH